MINKLTLYPFSTPHVPIASRNTLKETVQDHGVWAVRDKLYRGWMACYSHKAGKIEHVRDARGSIQIYDSEATAITAALYEHLHQQNEPRSPISGIAHKVVGAGRDKYLKAISKSRGKKHAHKRG